MSDKYSISNEVLNERSAQDRKWGIQNHTREHWGAILMEEVGEAAKADLENDIDGYRKEMIQVAAVAQAAVESLDRQLAAAMNQFDRFYVARPATIRDFVEAKTGRPYVPGDTFYEVKAGFALKHRAQVLQESTLGTIQNMGSMAAGTYITPVSSTRRRYVQSTSVNRRLPAGSYILVRR